MCAHVSEIQIEGSTGAVKHMTETNGSTLKSWLTLLESGWVENVYGFPPIRKLLINQPRKLMGFHFKFT